MADLQRTVYPHIGHPLATGLTVKRSTAKVRRSKTNVLQTTTVPVPRNQPNRHTHLHTHTQVNLYSVDASHSIGQTITQANSNRSEPNRVHMHRSRADNVQERFFFSRKQRLNILSISSATIYESMFHQIFSKGKFKIASFLGHLYPKTSDRGSENANIVL